MRRPKPVPPRRRIPELLVAGVLASSCGGAGEPGGDAGTEGTTDPTQGTSASTGNTTVTTRVGSSSGADARRAIFYWGHGGFDPARVDATGQFAGVGGFEQRVADLSAAGYMVEYTDVFPADLAEADMVVLIRPGKNYGQPQGAPFSDDEVAQLRSVLESGGVVVMGGDTDRSGIWTHDEANRVSAELGAGTVFTPGFSSEVAMTISAEPHALTEGVSTLLTLAAGKLTPGTEAACLAYLGATCILAAEALHGGMLVAVGDLQMIDDYAYPDEGVDNFDFLTNLVDPG